MLKQIIVLLIVAVAAGMYAVCRENNEREALYIHIMESYEDFRPAEVDELWRWKNENRTSARFNELYDARINPLPGGDWSSSCEDVRWRRR